MSQVNHTGANSKVGSEKGNCPAYEGSVDFAIKMEELQAVVNQKFNGMVGFLEQKFEDMNQKIMKLQAMLEELAATTRTNPVNKIHDMEQRCLKLQFNGNISLSILTGEQIKEEGGDYIQVFLVDNCAGTLVEFGPEASAEVEIVALEGDLIDREGDTLTDEKFRSKIAGEREGKKPILAGNLRLKLNKGIVSLSDVKFRSSARHNSGVFKLGARALDAFHGIRIIEATTKSFHVKDYRRKYNQKHYPPSASDAVWRLENIGKGGPIYERLMKEEVNSVEAFRALLSEDPERLKRLLGLSEKKWEATVNHAETCPPGNSKYCCQENTGVVNAVRQVPRHISDCGHAHASVLVASAYEDEGVVSFVYKKHHPPSLADEVWRLEKIGKDGAFHRRLSKERVKTVKDFLTLYYVDPTRLRNILGTGMSAKMWEVTVDHAQTCVLDKDLYFYYPSGSQHKKGVGFNIVGQVMGFVSDCQYITIEKLSETEKACARDLVAAAYRHWADVVLVDDEASLMDGSLFFSTIEYSSNPAMLATSVGSKSYKNGKCDYPEPSASSSHILPSIYSLGGSTSLDDFGLPTMDSMDVRLDNPLSIPGQVANDMIYDTDSMSQAFCDDEHLQYFDPDCTFLSSTLGSPTDLQTAVSGFMESTDSIDIAQRRWTMLFSVLRWFSIRRIVARKSSFKKVKLSSFKEVKIYC